MVLSIHYKLKILLQRIWEEKLEWNEEVSPTVGGIGERWRNELPLPKNHLIPRCYFQEIATVTSKQLHGFCDVSESAYTAIVYLSTTDSTGDAKVAIVMTKTKLGPIKQLIIPRLELCGALILARMLKHAAYILSVPMNDVYAWTDSTVVLSWLCGNPRRFKTFVGNQVSEVLDLIPPTRWSHVGGVHNPADLDSRRLYPGELVASHVWWQVPSWLHQNKQQWP